jgi:hypothetical protein
MGRKGVGSDLITLLEGFDKVGKGEPVPVLGNHCVKCRAVERYCPGHDGEAIPHGGRGRASTKFGHFTAGPVVTWTEDGGRVILQEDFTYVDTAHRRWTTTKGTVSDGASIPRGVWTFVGSPLKGGYVRAALIHDAYCVSRDEPWEEVHEMFYWGCRAGGVTRPHAKILYYTVYHFGPRWRVYNPGYQEGAHGQEPKAGPRNMALSNPDDARCIERVERFILSRDPSLEDMRETSPYSLGFPRITSKRR